MIFLSAGHTPTGPKTDPGAVANGLREADLTRELRDLVAGHLKRAGASFITDQDTESLADYIRRIKPGGGSVICDLHFNASSNPAATGVETIVKAGAAFESRSLASEINVAIAAATGIANRGVKDETQSHRSRLAILNTSAGISVLPEICFISNAGDLRAYQRGKMEIATTIAALLIRYDKLKS